MCDEGKEVGDGCRASGAISTTRLRREAEVGNGSILVVTMVRQRNAHHLMVSDENVRHGGVVGIERHRDRLRRRHRRHNFPYIIRPAVLGLVRLQK